MGRGGEGGDVQGGVEREERRNEERYKVCTG